MADRIVEMQASSTATSRSLESPLTKAYLPLTRLTKQAKIQSPIRWVGTKPDNDWCYYHMRFDSGAHKCIKPCSFSGNDQAKE